MDGIPNTPGGAPSDAPQATIVCPNCGATVAMARFCGACGADLPAGASGATAGGPLAASPAPTAPREARVGAAPAATAATPAPSSQPEPPAAAPVADDGDGKACAWCGAVNPPGATTCASCNATFPTPEGDAALERAARERIQEMQKEINSGKARGSSWWPFRSR